MEKIYEVEFMEYTNCMRDIVRNKYKEMVNGILMKKSQRFCLM